MRKPYFWEYMWYVGYILPLVVYAGFEYYAPQRTSVVHEGRREAIRRMEKRGETFGWPFPPDYKDS